MTLDQISCGIFPKNHSLFPGKPWYGLSHFNKHKTFKLGLCNNHIVKVEDFGKFPVLPENPTLNFGGLIKDYCKNWLEDSDITDRFHCRVSNCGTKFVADCCVGKNNIPKILHQDSNALVFPTRICSEDMLSVLFLELRLPMLET